ncbi:MAG: DUF2442 domain-containing protein [Oceanospirillaceae bacterium]|nr:DUF2442 domain-containing protein [Oceanospirillaceae bacterium]
MYPAVINVNALNDYLLRVEFENGQQGVLDMSPFLTFGVFKQIRNKEQFKQVKVSFDTIEWSSGADLDPEFVYEKVVFDI